MLTCWRRSCRWDWRGLAGSRGGPGRHSFWCHRWSSRRPTALWSGTTHSVVPVTLCDVCRIEYTSSRGRLVDCPVLTANQPPRKLLLSTDLNRRLWPLYQASSHLLSAANGGTVQPLGPATESCCGSAGQVCTCVLSCCRASRRRASVASQSPIGARGRAQRRGSLEVDYKGKKVGACCTTKRTPVFGGAVCDHPAPELLSFDAGH